LRFFAPLGRHVAPMGVKFSTEECTVVHFSMTNFALIGATIKLGYKGKERKTVFV